MRMTRRWVREQRVAQRKHESDVDDTLARQLADQSKNPVQLGV